MKKVWATDLSGRAKSVLESLPFRDKGLWTYNKEVKRESGLESCENSKAILESWKFQYAPHLFRYWRAMKFIEDYGGVDSVIADIGCGFGELAKMLVAASHGEQRKKCYIGLDTVRGRLIQAELNPWGNFDHCFLRFDLSRGFLPFKDESIDLVIFMEVIEHMEEEVGQELIESIFRCLKPGARVFFTAPFASFKKSDLVKTHHVYLRTQREYEVLLESAGFSIEEESGMQPWPSVRSFQQFPELKKLSEVFPRQIFRALAGFILPIQDCQRFSAVCRKEVGGRIVDSRLVKEELPLQLGFLGVGGPELIRHTACFGYGKDRYLKLVGLDGKIPKNPFKEVSGIQIAFQCLVEGGKLNEVILRTTRMMQKVGLSSHISGASRVKVLVSVIENKVNQQKMGISKYDFSKYQIVGEN